MTATLERELRSAVRGEVRFDDGARALYATDASNYRKVPIGVVTPIDPEDTAAALRVCLRHGVPILPRGGGTSLAGQCCNTAVVLDFTRHQRGLLSLDPDQRIARVQPGLVLDDLRRAAQQHGLTFGPDPSTHGWCTLGGMIGNNSCGVHSVQAGRTSDNVHALRILTADATELELGGYPGVRPRGGCLGQVIEALGALIGQVGDRVRERYPRIPRRVSGYNLDALLPERGFHVARSLVGSEGTCAVITEATVRLVPWPAHRVLLVLGYPDVYEAADHVPEVLTAGPIGLEGIDAELVRGMREKGVHVGDLAELTPGGGWLLVELGGDTPGEARDRADGLVSRLKGPSHRLLVDPDDQRRLWEVRESGLPATARIPGRPDTWEGWEDSAVPPEALGGYLRDLRALFARYGFRASTYGHFGEGCVHTRIPFELRTDAGIAQFRAFVEEASELVLRYGGTFSGEHGDGQSKAELLVKMFGPELIDAFRRFKRIWDPEGRMNPGRVVDPDPITSHLRVAQVQTLRPATAFRFPEDRGSLARAAERCVGVGKCRGFGAGTMCPSYRATLDERHSTRGRAHLLYEMLRADSPIASGAMQSRAVHDALELCLSCKGCKSDCPMGVDLATYKAEFSHHWYRWRLRPRIAYLFGFMPWTAPLLTPFSGAINRLSQERWARRLLGVHPDRPIPPLADRTFRRRIRGRPLQSEGERVALWIDSWTQHFLPEVGLAAVEVLERAGFSVAIPEPACCGRPLYDFGMLGPARRALRRCLEVTGPLVEQGLPLVTLEPSCASVFRDELPALMPDDPSARRLASATTTLAELLTRRRPGLEAGLGQAVLYHAHCHHKAVLGTAPDIALLRRLGARVEVLDAGCCGMCGIFGYEEDKYEVSRKVGETGVLPAVRAAAPETLICADGFSCRTQLQDLAGRRALHLAEVARLALEGRCSP